MNKLFGLAIAVVVVVALLTVFKEQTVKIAGDLFATFSQAVNGSDIFVFPKIF
ncbi:MAG: hypothetical protein N4A68_05575 [Maledivibacter sp.]|jgi:energy-converting hydrogenase Eha subunit G|nr:hypothetical protein [Maledivibacter sp.]